MRDYVFVREMFVILAADPVIETLEDIATSNLSTVYRLAAGNIRLPITDDFAVIKHVNVTLQSVGPGWSWELIDKNITIGPRIQIYNSTGGLSDALIDARIQGV